MIVSKYSKSYDTADGSEQQFKERRLPSGEVDVQHVEAVRADAAAVDASQTVKPNGTGADGQRWDDDGGGSNAGGGAERREPPRSSLEFSDKPTWSVLSLRDLNLAVRLGDWPDNPDHMRRLAADAERASARSAELEARRTSARVHAHRNRDRNPWENT